LFIKNINRITTPPTRANIAGEDPAAKSSNEHRALNKYPPILKTFSYYNELPSNEV
jgi:hypothetical protein